MNIGELSYFAGYAFRTTVLKQNKPLVAGMPLTDVCNLHCRHCVVANTGRGHYTLGKVEELFRHFYSLGVRILYLQGGEVMTWQDGDLRVDDVIRRARAMGFYKIATVTNGTLGLPSAADLVWVSVDGSEPAHDAIRGKGNFRLMMENVSRARHPRVVLNMTVNRVNAGEIENVAGIARDTAAVYGVSFNFHTPYRGVEDLCLPPPERVAAVDRILKLKKEHFPVINTESGLKVLRKNKWRRPISAIQLVEQDRIFECCWGREQPGVCDNCGYGVIAELSQILNFNLPAIRQSLSLFK